MSAVAIIPARGGSKRIPRKNIRAFCGRPMIAWVIQTALHSRCFESVLVSTEDAEIAEVSRQCGARVPFMRDTRLADDFTGTGAVMKDAIHQFETQFNAVDQYCCIYPTAALLTVSDLTSSRALMLQHQAPFVFGVGRYTHPIQRALITNEQGCLIPLHPEKMKERTQDLSPGFFDAGQFTWGQAEAWRSDANLFSGEALGYELPRNRLVDIDTEEDWLLAEMLFTRNQGRDS